MTDENAPLPSWGRPEPTDRRRRALVVGGASAAALLLAVAVFTGVSGASDGGGYRTALVSTEDVQRTLTGVGTIEPVDQAAVAFPVSGTVESVDVSVGSTVVAGQVLASLDTESLTTSLHEAEAKLASAQLTLEKGLNGEATTTGAGGLGGSSPSASSPSASSTSSASSSASAVTSAPSTSSADTDALVAARQAVAAAQHQLDVDLAAAEQALAESTTACSSDSTVTTSTTTSSTSTTLAGASTQACQDALAASLAAQQVVAADEAALQQAVNQLDTLLSSSSGAPSGGSSTVTMTGSPSGSTSSGSSVTSADLIAYQKAVDAAAAEVTVAQQALAQATIVSPISGTVTSVGIAVGDSVSAASSSDAILVSGAGGYEVTTSVAVTDLPHVSVGQPARVVADGSTTELRAQVVQISLVPSSSSSSSTTTYTVVLALTDPDVDLPNGGLARTTIVAGDVASTTAVPTSAVTATETGRSVTVLDGGTTSTVSVTVGTVGSTWTEITDGVSVGQTVVLADLSQGLPGSATDSSSNSSTSGANGRTGGFTLPSGGSFSPPSGGGVPTGR
jgi:trimeric autotransporter adhesin